jgi:hypothetical protein
MSTHRALATGLLFAFTIAAAYASPNSVKVEVRDDGSVTIEGVHYTDPTPLGVALKELRRRRATIHVWAPPAMRFEPIGKAILLLQKAGCAEDCMQIGFITGPASSH